MPIAQALAVVIGGALVLIILWDAFETILVPRRIGRSVRLTRYFYIFTWRAWRALARRVRKPARRETLLGWFGPMSLLLLLGCWATGLIVGFALLALGAHARAGFTASTFALQLYESGETFFTLGFGDFTPSTAAGRLLAVIESGLGFGFLGTVVGYLPTMYAAFAQREVEISLMDARAGSPPSACEFLRRTAPVGDDTQREAVLVAWERWAAQLLETHISYPQLAYYRSQHGNQSWLAALVTILDSTSLLLARAGTTPASQAQRTFAMARHALVDITQIFVRRYVPVEQDRLRGEDARAMRAVLVASGLDAAEAAAMEARLAELRPLYEPYAQALAAHLLFTLPAWTGGSGRPDNWQRAPWDKQISASRAAHRGDDHF